MYLNNYDWSRIIAAGIAAVDAATNTKRSANLTGMSAHDGFGHRTLLTHRCPEMFEDDQDSIILIDVGFSWQGLIYS
jgi:hypothetical protein